jgi:glycine hydroxymethyltransferase
MKDKQIEELIKAEKKRQTDGLELIPSENYVSSDVLQALGSVFTNKYSEGYPGRRYYGGQENTDQVEQLAIDRAKKLFKADHANVKPHSGAQANEAVYYAWCEPGDTILAMDLAHGGHLTHGAPVTRSAREYNFIRYGIKNIDTGEIDYEEIRQLALKHKPKIILAGFSAYPRELDYEKFAEIGNEPKILLGAENPFGAQSSAMAIKVPTESAEYVFGILGPNRMDYSRNLALIKLIQELTSNLNNQDENYE